MAKQVQVVLIDDISGEELGDDAQTVNFGLDGVAYEIDVSAANAGELRSALEPYVSNARRVGGRKSTASAGAKTDKEQLQAIRRWAKENGHDVSERGRISAKVMEAYEAAH